MIGMGSKILSYRVIISNTRARKSEQVMMGYDIQSTNRKDAIKQAKAMWKKQFPFADQNIICKSIKP